MSRGTVSRLCAIVGVAAVRGGFLVATGGAGAGGMLVASNLYPLVSDSSAVTAPAQDPSHVNGWG